MIKKQHLLSRWKERGNIFFTLFAAVGVVGALGVGSVTLLKGPVQTMVKINQKQVTEEYSELGLRVMMANTLQTDANCDGDNKLEAAEWDTPVAPDTAPSGGGVFPSTFGTKITDPWGRRLGYCVWDHGSAIDDVGCGGGTQNRLRGAAADDTQPFITVISSGANQIFETSCNDYVDASPADGTPDTALLVKPANSDDLIVNYSMIGAKAAMGDNWVFDSNETADADAATTTQNLDFSQDVTFDGLLDLSKLGGGLILPDFSTATCDGTTDGQMFRDSATTPPAVMVCDGGTWKAMSGASSSGNYAYDFDPESANCTLNNGGPFVLEGTYNTTSIARGVWGDGTYIYLADGANGVHAFSFNGSSFTLEDTYGTTSGAKDVWGDSTYIYVADGTSGVHAFSFNGSSFTLEDTYNTTDRAKGVWGDGTYIYVADGTSGVHAFSFDGSSFTLEDTYDTTGGAKDVWGDGTYIYLADGNSWIHAFSFDGSSFTLEDTYNTTDSARGVWGDGTYIYVANDDSGVHAFSFDGSSFTLEDTYDTPSSAEGVWGDGTYIYVADIFSGVHAFSFDGSSFTLEDTYDTTGAADNVWGDGTYIYVAADSGGIHAFSGFECMSTTGGVRNRPDAPNTGVDYNYRAYGWGRETNSGLGDGGGAVNTDQQSPNLLLNNNEFFQVASTIEGGCGLKTDGSAWCWGMGLFGGIGDGTQTDRDVPVKVIGDHQFIKIDKGFGFSCGLKNNGTLWCWGRDVEGQLGDDGGITANKTSPVKVITISDFIDFSIGHGNVCGIRKNGEIWCWGDETNGELGNGSETTAQQNTPVKVQTSTSSFVQISISGSLACAVTNTGDIWCWGSNNYGQLGSGTIGINEHTPQKVITDITNFTQVSTDGSHTCALRKNGEMWCWGRNHTGQLGEGSLTGTQTSPVKVVNVNDFIKLSVGVGITCGITSNGNGYCWGADNYGQLGNGATGAEWAPISTLDGISDLVNIDCGKSTCFATTKTLKNVPEVAPIAPVIIQQSTTSGNTMGSHGLAIQYNSTTNGNKSGLAFTIDAQDTDGTDLSSTYITSRYGSNGGIRMTVYDGSTNQTLRINKNGALSINSVNSNLFPKISMNEGAVSWNGTRFDNGVLLSDVGGANKSAYYGIDDTTGNAIILSGEDLLIQHTATDGTGRTTIASFVNTGVPEFYGDIFVQGNNNTATVSAYTDTAIETAAFKFLRYRGTIGAPSAVISSDYLGEISFKGFDGTDYNANGTMRLYSQSSTSISTGNVDARIKITTNDGTSNGNQNLKIGKNGGIHIGVPVVTIGSILQTEGRGAADEAVKAGMDTNCAAADDEGAIRFTGTEYEYCKNDGSYFWESVVPDPTCEDDAIFTDISLSYFNSCATLSNGQSICWGSNSYDQVGIGGLGSPQLDPLPITTHKAIQSSPGGAEFSCFLTDNNRVKCAGRNHVGQLGNSTSTNTSVPVFITSNYKYKKVKSGSTASCAIRTTGKLDCWGKQSNGEIGDGTTTIRKTPVPVDGISNVIDIALDKHTCVVLSNRTVKCWGQNNAGQLGIGTETANETSPQDVTITNVIKITAADLTSGTELGGTCALKGDGTVWCWGDNTYGQIGNGTSGAANVTTPTQVSGITTAIDMARNRRTAFALLEDGTIQYWGVGPDSLPTSTTPITIAGITTAIKLATTAQAQHMCWILEDGRAQCIGNQPHGQLGDGTTSNSNTPVDVINPLSCAADKYVFVTSTKYDGNIGGVLGADNICQAHADRANLPGRYMAWISDSNGNSPSTRFNRILTDYKLVDDTVVANGWSDLTDGTLDNGITLFEDGTPIVVGAIRSWADTLRDGTFGNVNSCNNWTSNNGSLKGRRGAPGYTSANWSESSSQTCSGNSSNLTCFQQ